MYSINDVYETMSSDLGISSFSGESQESFHNRLVYSGIANWILSLCLDRDSEEISESNDRVLKSHVTITGRDTLLSFLKADKNLQKYFPNKKIIDFIHRVEDAYVSLGYFDSDNFCFLSSKYQALIPMLSSRINLIIDYPCYFAGMNGLGLFRSNKENCKPSFELTDYFHIQKPAKEAFASLVDYLKYEPFYEQAIKGNVQYFHPLLKQWLAFDGQVNFDYLLLRFDGFSYSLLRKNENNLFIAQLPFLYRNDSKDIYHKQEIWRVILGYCAFLGYGFEATFQMNKNDNYCFIKFSRFILPFKEGNFIRCLCWPIRDCLDCWEYGAWITFIPTIKYVLSLLSITLKEVF